MTSSSFPETSPRPPAAVEIASPSGLSVRLVNTGAAIQSLRVPAANGPVETILGFTRPNEYQGNPSYIGVTVGRYANRIEDALLRLDGHCHALTPTPGQLGHCLHGGLEGFSHRTWDSEVIETGKVVHFSLRSPAGDQGFPGNLETSVRYSLLDDWTLRIDYEATTDATTVVSLANHAYFNLDGDGASVSDHRLQVHADRFTPLKDNLIPNGDLQPVEGTPLDLRHSVRVGDIRPEDHPQLALAAGLDHNYVLRGDKDQPHLAASLRSPASGIRMDLHTTLPGLQVYGGQHLKAPFSPGAGLCLEAQHFPNAPNEPGFPSPVLNPGERYRHSCLYRFSVD